MRKLIRKRLLIIKRLQTEYTFLYLTHSIIVSFFVESVWTFSISRSISSALMVILQFLKTRRASCDSFYSENKANFWIASIFSDCQNEFCSKKLLKIVLDTKSVRRRVSFFWKSVLKNFCVPCETVTRANIYDIPLSATRLQNQQVARSAPSLPQCNRRR